MNSARHLEECIKSVQSQDYQNLEHIVQDGGSTDGTLEVLERYRVHLTWTSECDSGQGDALTRAFARSCGEIIAILDSDNTYAPDALSWAVQQFDEHPDAAVIYGDIALIDDAGASLGIVKGPDPYRFERIFCCDDVIPSQAAFIKAEPLRAVGLPAIRLAQTCPDFDLWALLGTRFAFYHVPSTVARYRLHPGSETANPLMAAKFLRAKMAVVARTCSDPSASDAVRKMRNRAVAGLYAASAISVGRTDRRMRFHWVSRAIALDPTPARVKRLFVGLGFSHGLSVARITRAMAGRRKQSTVSTQAAEANRNANLNRAN